MAIDAWLRFLFLTADDIAEVILAVDLFSKAVVGLTFF
jgi:hypothetical protein